MLDKGGKGVERGRIVGEVGIVRGVGMLEEMAV